MTSTLSEQHRADPVRARRTRAFALPEVRWAAAATVLFAAGLVAQFGGGEPWLWWSLYLACYAAGGWQPGLAGLRALRAGTLDIDLLMVVAAIGAASIGHVTDGGLLIVIFAISGALEALATRRTADSVSALLDLSPEQARVLRADGEEQTVPVAELAVGDVVLVRPGERIGADGKVTDGASDVDQASVTGESLPVSKDVGSEVFAGTLNGAGALRVAVSRPASDSVIARIVALVEQASATKARTQLFVERIEQYYSVGVVTATVALFAVPLSLGADLDTTLLRAMTFMIVASPCAVVLSTMPPLLSSIANGGRHGVLVKSAVVMEQLGTATRVAFDKTGTLTEGTPRLVEIQPLAGYERGELLRLAAAAEHGSEHPLARAVVHAARDDALDLPAAQDFAAEAGRGVRARVSGQVLQVGNPAALLPALTDEDPAGTHAAVDALEGRGRSVAVVLVDGLPAGLLGLADRARPGAAAAVAQLAALTGNPPVLLTGDNDAAARALAAEVGITEVRAGLLPEDKVTAVREYEAAGEKVLIVGDGVNDAPALAAATVGVAMGNAGADLTLETADAIVIRDELGAIPAIVALSQRSRRFVIANLTIAGAFIVGLVSWPAFGHLPLVVGVAFHEGSTVIVGLNGLRLLREAAWPRAPGGIGGAPAPGGSVAARQGAGETTGLHPDGAVTPPRG